MTDENEEWANMWCPECETENIARKQKNGLWKCDICGLEFTREESEDAQNTYVEEMDIF